MRFDEAATATAALAVEGVGTLSVLSGADEEQYWDKIKAAGNAGGRGGKGGRGGGGRQGRGRGGGRGKPRGGRFE